MLDKCIETLLLIFYCFEVVVCRSSRRWNNLAYKLIQRVTLLSFSKTLTLTADEPLTCSIIAYWYRFL